jgi:short-subunit dehydrogenase
MLQYTAFITGANRGLGLEFTRQYAANNWNVLASCRSLVQAKELQQLAQHFPNVTLLQLDVTNSIQLNHLADKYADTSIDLLINNAGLFIEDDLHNFSVEGMKQSFLTNAVAPLKISTTFIENINRSHLKTIVAISSRMASINDTIYGEAYSFRASKTALNMIMKNLSADLRKKHIKIFTIHPGSVKTDTGGSNAIISAEQSVAHIRSLLLRLTERESGKFYDYLGNELDW